MTGATTAAQTPRRMITEARPMRTFPAIVSLMGNHAPARLTREIKCDLVKF